MHALMLKISVYPISENYGRRIRNHTKRTIQRNLLKISIYASQSLGPAFAEHAGCFSDLYHWRRQHSVKSYLKVQFYGSHGDRQSKGSTSGSRFERFNASRKDLDGYYIPEYLFMDAKQKYETMQDALITYLVMRQIPYPWQKENEPVLQILSEDYFVENYPAIEHVVFTVVTDFVNRR